MASPGFRDPDYANYPLELTPLGSRFVKYILEYEDGMGEDVAADGE